MASGMASLEETIRQIMEQQVARLGAALEARIDLRTVEVSKSVAEAEHGWRVERQERERSLMALQRDMLTLTDSAVKERDLIEKVFQDLATVHTQHAELLSRAQQPAAAAELEAEMLKHQQSIALHAAKLDEQLRLLQRLDQRVAEIADTPRSSMPLQSGVESQDVALLQSLRQLQQQMYEQFAEMETERAARVRDTVEFRAALQDVRSELGGVKVNDAIRGVQELYTQVNALFTEVGDIRQMSAKAQDQVEKHFLDAAVRDDCKQFKEEVDEVRVGLTKELEDLRAEVCHLRHAQSSRVSELCSNALAGWAEVQREVSVSIEHKLDGFREALHSRVAEFQRSSKDISAEIALERDDRCQTLVELRTHLSSTVGDSVHRIELLESDLIDMTRTLKRMDLRIKEVARASAARYSQACRAQKPVSPAEGSFQQRSATPPRSVIVSGFEDVDGPLGSLLEAAGAPMLSDVPSVDTSQQLRVELLRRAAGSNAALNSMLKRARELGEV